MCCMSRLISYLSLPVSASQQFQDRVPSPAVPLRKDLKHGADATRFSGLRKVYWLSVSAFGVRWGCC